jgi:predicted DNA-binding protein (UPF0251 family)
MTGKQFKALIQKRHGTYRWASAAARDMQVSRSTIWRWCKMAKVPDLPALLADVRYSEDE